MTYLQPLYPEPPAGTVVTWQQRFNSYGPTYTYAAINVPGRGWYVTDRFDKVYTWAELCRRYIRNSPVLVATNWAALPAQVGATL